MLLDRPHRYGPTIIGPIPRRFGQSSLFRHHVHRRMASGDRIIFWKWLAGVGVIYGAIAIMTLTALVSWVDCLGLVAGAAVLTTFLMRTMQALRSVALLSNVLFVTYGLSADVYPIALLHAILLPINAIKLRALLQHAD